MKVTAIYGPPGTGKTTVARLIAEGLGLLAILGLGIRLRGKAPPSGDRLR